MRAALRTTPFLLAFALLGCPSSGPDPQSAQSAALAPAHPDVQAQSGASVPCGGGSSTQCPSGATCLDDPSDQCDPKALGDCPGLCVSLACGETKACPQGWRCGDQGTCVELTVATCGGFEARPCPGGSRCIDDGTDDCDPKKSGLQCPGLCVPQ